MPKNQIGVQASTPPRLTSWWSVRMWLQAFLWRPIRSKSRRPIRLWIARCPRIIGEMPEPPDEVEIALRSRPARRAGLAAPPLCSGCDRAQEGQEREWSTRHCPGVKWENPRAIEPRCNNNSWRTLWVGTRWRLQKSSSGSYSCASVASLTAAQGDQLVALQHMKAERDQLKGPARRTCKSTAGDAAGPIMQTQQALIQQQRATSAAVSAAGSSAGKTVKHLDVLKAARQPLSLKDRDGWGKWIPGTNLLDTFGFRIPRWSSKEISGSFGRRRHDRWLRRSWEEAFCNVEFVDSRDANCSEDCKRYPWPKRFWVWTQGIGAWESL